MNNASDSIGSVPHFDRLEAAESHSHNKRYNPHSDEAPQVAPSNEPRRQTEGYRVFTFLLCVTCIYSFQLVNALIEERIYKVPYKRINSDETDLYSDAITPMVFGNLFAVIIGYVKLNDQELSMPIPSTKILKVVVVDIGIHVLLMIAMMKASYILMVMANTCGLLSIILVGVYFSRQRQLGADRSQGQEDNPASPGSGSSPSTGLGYDKILTCLIVCCGMFIFNFYSQPGNSAELSPSNKTGSASQNQHTSSDVSIALVLLLVAVILEGFKPELQTRIKEEYRPTPICFYFHFNRVQLLVTLLGSLCSLRLFYTVQFIALHDELLLHIVIMALFNAICALFVYKIITMFRQHIYPLLGTVRKCLSVGLSALYFGHHLQPLQFLGIALVFGGVMLQISLNYKICEKYDIDLPFVDQVQKREKYVRNSQSSKKYSIYKTLAQQNEGVEGI